MDKKIITEEQYTEIYEQDIPVILLRLGLHYWNYSGSRFKMWLANVLAGFWLWAFVGRNARFVQDSWALQLIVWTKHRDDVWVPYVIIDEWPWPLKSNWFTRRRSIH